MTAVNQILDATMHLWTVMTIMLAQLIPAVPQRVVNTPQYCVLILMPAQLNLVILPLDVKRIL